MDNQLFTTDILEFLCTDAGEEAMALAAKLDPYKVSDAVKLRKKCSGEQARAIFELLELRSRARVKFARADQMFFNRVGYEQSSGDVLADYKAGRIAKKYEGGLILDLCCGIGGDAAALAGVGKIKAVDFDPVKLKMAELNLKVYGRRGEHEFECADLNDIELDGELFHLDPDQRTGAKRRSFEIDDLSPTPKFIDSLLKRVPDGVIKLSPAADYLSLPWGGEIELVSYKGQCRQLIVWTGKFAEAELRATTIKVDSDSGDVKIFSVDSGMEQRLEVSEIGKYLYDPDPSVSRLRLLGQLAFVMGLDFLYPGQVILSANELVINPLARAYKVEEILPYHEDKVRKYFRANPPGPVTVKPRGAEVNVDKLSKMFSTKKGSGRHLFLLRLDKRIVAVVTTLQNL